jgi:exopolysaccharide biosynthesis polyprenyl glycosylphosphotransferase
MIPRRFFWLFDFAAFCLAFGAAHVLLPITQAILVGIIPRVAPPGMLSLPLPEWLGSVPSLNDLAWILVVVSTVGMLTLAALGAYRGLLEQSLSRVVLSSVLAPLAGLSLITQILFALKNPDWSRLFIFSFAGLTALFLIAYRSGLRLYFFGRQRAGVYARNLLLIGTPAGVTRLCIHAAPMVSRGYYRLFGYLRLSEAPEDGVGHPLLDLGCVTSLRQILIYRPIHEVILAQPADGGPWLRQVIEDCDGLGVPVQVIPEQLLDFEPAVLRVLHPPTPLALPAVVLTTRHFDSHALFFKRLVDMVASAVLLCLFSPVLVLTALAVKLSSSGPILYTWRVIGEQGREFTGYKFRTMVQDADTRKADLWGHNEMAGPVFKMASDPRTTRVGRFLRKYSIDELPQLYSVLKGDMSLVGPRPAFRNELERYELWQKRKLSIRPGITCLWQVNGRNKIHDFDDWVKLDLEYIDNWSLWLDFKILLRTAWVVVAGTGR